MGVIRLRGERGFTILEVIIAITIFLIGMGFIVQSVGAASRFSAQYQLRQQMAFYAAGLLEAELENPTLNNNTIGQFIQNQNVPPPFSGLGVEANIQPYVDQNGQHIAAYLEQVSVTVYKPTGTETSPSPNDLQVTITTYRLKQ